MSDINMSLEILVKQLGDHSEHIAKLSDRIGELINIEAARVERDHQQEKKNEEFEKFMQEHEETIKRTKRWHALIDSAMTKVLGSAMFGVIVYLIVTSHGMPGVTK